eukprot:comp22743_c0_seq1/m.35463 comp22743_c0_seq1/g.35463  ORF comp22743_c0_seq1/g.35463 comp22743_c0_seq1/m.35463 type:complete len:701 (-) comp22743_c0_seq1:84-2186(-)
MDGRGRGRGAWNSFADSPRQGTSGGRGGDRRDGRDDRRSVGGRGGGGQRYETSQDDPREYGIVDKLTDNYGFIECVEKPQRIFFHYSHVQGDVDSLRVGDGLEFTVGTDSRTGKLVAYNVVPLPPGTVSFETVDPQRVQGDITFEVFGRGPSYGKLGGDPGRVRYQLPDGKKEIAVFHAQDQTDPTCELKKGDRVEFNVATDKRNGMRRAVDLVLVERAMPPLLYGNIASLKDKFGFIKPMSKDSDLPDIFFHYSEYDGDVNALEVGMEVSYSEKKRQRETVAATVKVLPLGALDEIAEGRKEGVVVKGLVSGRANYGREAPSGKIESREGEETVTYAFYEKDVRVWGEPVGEDKVKALGKGDKVVFSVAKHKVLTTERAVEVDLFERAPEKKEHGYVCVLREGGGFIERVGHVHALPFSLRDMAADASADSVALGCEVEFKLTRKQNKPAAVSIRVVPNGTIVRDEEKSEEVYVGTVERSYTVSPDRCGGSVRYEADSQIHSHTYGISAVDCSARPLKAGDVVSFGLVGPKGGKKKRATDVRILYDTPAGEAPKHRGKVESVDGQKGSVKIVSPAIPDMPSAVFYLSAVQGGQGVSTGDDVEFVLLTNNLTGEKNACRLRRTAPRTVLQAKSESRFGPVRQPRGPDGTKGFQSRSGAIEISETTGVVVEGEAAMEGEEVNEPELVVESESVSEESGDEQ